MEEVEGRYFNRSYILDKCGLTGNYDKIYPFDNEGRGLISPGYEYKVFEIRGLRIGILICADV